MRCSPSSLGGARRRSSATAGAGARRLAALAGSIALGLAGCATAAPYNPEHLAPADHAEVAGLCTGVIGLRPGVEQYDACLEALSASVRDLSRGRALTASRTDCLRQGLAPGSRALAQCELDRSRTGEGAPQGMAALSATQPARIVPARSYWSASNAEIHRREETACAELGLEPVGGPFAGCVASLDAALFAANNPSH